MCSKWTIVTSALFSAYMERNPGMDCDRLSKAVFSLHAFYADVKIKKSNKNACKNFGQVYGDEWVYSFVVFVCYA